MELRVETADGSALPKGCFVSVRVGEVQKQRRYENRGAFQFPAPAHTRKAKIDLYQHVATCSVPVGPESRTSEVFVQALEPGGATPCLRVESSVKLEVPIIDRETKLSNVKKEAVDYLSKWLIQERLGEAVKALLQKRPDDPIEFICGYLRSHAGNEPVALKKAPAPSPAPVPSPSPAPLPAPAQADPAPAAPAAEPKPAAQVGKAAGNLEEVKHKARSALERAFLHVDAKADPASGSFQERPSVGTWLRTRPKREARAGQAEASPAAKQTGAAEEEEFQVRPSVGTWIMRRPSARLAGAQPASLKVSWDLAGFGPAKGMGEKERAEVEGFVTKALLQLDGPLAGEYLPLATSTSYGARPGGMSPSERQVLLATGLLMQADDAQGRGVFVTPKRDLAVWVNGDHHVQMIAKQNFAAPAVALSKLRDLEKRLGEVLAALGHGFSPAAASSSKRLSGFGAPAELSVEERCEVERLCTRSFLELTGDLEGEYFPNASSVSYPPRPGGMTPQQEQELAGFGLLLGSCDATGRGVFVTKGRELAVAVNGEGHLELLARCPEKGPALLQRMEAALGEALQRSGSGGYAS